MHLAGIRFWFGTQFAIAARMKPFAPAVVVGMALSLGSFGCSQNGEQTVPVVDSQVRQETAATRPAEPTRGFVRGVHLVPGLAPISLRTGAQTFAPGLTFGNAAPYEGIKEAIPGGPATGAKLGIEAIGGDGKKIAGPMPVTLEPGEELTVFATGVPGDVALLPFKPKTFGIEKGRAKIAFIHAGRALPAVAVRIDDKSFRRSVKYGVASDYVVLAPGRHRMEVQYDEATRPQIVNVEQPAIITQDELGNVLDVSQPPSTTAVVPQKTLVTLKQEIDLMADKVYQVVLFQGTKQLPQLRLLEDRFADDLVKARPAER